MKFLKRHFERQKPHIGIDIGHRYLRGVSLSKDIDRVSVENYFIFDLLEVGLSVEDKQVYDFCLNEIVKQCELTDSNVHLSLPYGDHASYEFHLPNMPEQDLRKVLENKIEDLVEYPLSNANYKYLKIEDGSGEGKSLYKVYCTNTEPMLKKVSLLKGIDLNVNFIEPEPLSIVALLDFNECTSDESSHLVVDIGESQITVFLVYKNKVLNVNQLNYSLSGLQNILEEKMGMTPQEAEEEKLNFSFDSSYGGNEIVQSLFDDFYCSIFDEIKRLEKLYSLQLGQSHVDSILLTGGGCGCHMIDEAISSFCQIPTFIVNPLRKIDATAPGIESEFLEQRKHLLSTAIGLALKGVA